MDRIRRGTFTGEAGRQSGHNPARRRRRPRDRFEGPPAPDYVSQESTMRARFAFPLPRVPTNGAGAGNFKRLSMRKSAALFVILCAGAAASLSIGSNLSAGTITVHINEKMGAIDPRIYGHFTEMTLSSFEGSVSSEMLFNRKFEIQEERNTNPPVFTGVSAGWEPIALDTSITMVQDSGVFYSPSYSQRITLSDRNNVPAGLQQSGYRYVMPQDRKSTRLNSSHSQISYAVFCLKKK